MSGRRLGDRNMDMNKVTQIELMSSWGYLEGLLGAQKSSIKGVNRSNSRRKKLSSLQIMLLKYSFSLIILRQGNLGVFFSVLFIIIALYLIYETQNLYYLYKVFVSSPPPNSLERRKSSG